MNTTAQIEKKIYIKKLFYLGEIFMISFNKIYFFKGFKFVRKMQSSQTRRGGGSRWISAIPFRMEKLEWLSYHMVKKFRRYLYSFWRNSRT